MSSITFKERAFLIMHVHAIKYHNFDCLGVLIGNKSGNEVIIEDSVALFH